MNYPEFFRGNGLPVFQNKMFNEGLALSAEYIVLRHVLEYIANFSLGLQRPITEMVNYIFKYIFANLAAVKSLFLTLIQPSRVIYCREWIANISTGCTTVAARGR